MSERRRLSIATQIIIGILLGAVLGISFGGGLIVISSMGQIRDLQRRVGQLESERR